MVFSDSIDRKKLFLMFPFEFRHWQADLFEPRLVSQDHFKAIRQDMAHHGPHHRPPSAVYFGDGWMIGIPHGFQCGGMDFHCLVVTGTTGIF